MIEFLLDNACVDGSKMESLITADEMALRYDVILGGFMMNVHGARFDMNWGWVPLLDAAAGLWDVILSLKASSYEVFEFTESSARLCFLRNENRIKISSNFQEGEAFCELEDLKAAVDRFRRDLLLQAQNHWPALRMNPIFSRLLTTDSRY